MDVDEASAAESLAVGPQQSPEEASATKESSSPSSVAFAQTPNEESVTTKESSAANTAEEILPKGADVGTKECSSVSVTLQTTKESSAAARLETLTKEEVSVASKESSVAAVDEAAQSMEDSGAAKEFPANGTLPPSLSACGDSSDENGEDSSLPDEGSSGKTLEYADELMEKGMKAKKADEFVEAIDCFSRALEIRVSHYGELAPECLTAYYNYGLVLLYKAQEEADPLVSAPEKRSNSTRNSEADTTVKSGEESEASMTSISTDAKQDCGSSANDRQLEQGVGNTEKEEVSEGGEGDGEDVSDGEEEESDLDLAWAMLDVARAIVEKLPHDSLEKVDILTALGEVSLEREDFQTSLSDYCKALSILESLVEPDSRRIVELNFRICLVLEVGEKAEDAVPYCQKAVSVCKARLQRLRDEAKNSASTTATIVDTSLTSDLNQKERQPVVTPDSSALERESEIESLVGLLSDLEQKLEDLQQTIVNTRKAFSVLKMIGANSLGNERGASSSTDGAAKSSEKVNSSQMAVVSGGFDSPAVSTAATNGNVTHVSTAATNGNVTHLGVVGRGVKRATLNPIGGEPPVKKPSMESSEEKEGSISQA